MEYLDCRDLHTKLDINKGKNQQADEGMATLRLQLCCD